MFAENNSQERVVEIVRSNHKLHIKQKDKRNM